MSAIGFGDPEREKQWEELWPAQVHMVGKEILRFHAVYWPAFLMAAGLPLPKKIYAHGWLIFQEEKMSKSKGNIVRSKPIRLAMGADGLRYYLLREIVFGSDGNFSYDALVGRYNSDLANGIGNLLSRTVTMVHRYADGAAPNAPEADESGLAAKAAEVIPQVISHYENFAFSKALEGLWAFLAAVDRYLVEQKPWVLAKEEGAAEKAQLAATLYNAAEVLRIACVLAYPVLPELMPVIWKTLGQSGELAKQQLKDLKWGGLEVGTKFSETEVLFPRLDVEQTVNQMADLEKEVLKEQAEVLGKLGARRRRSAQERSPGHRHARDPNR